MPDPRWERMWSLFHEALAREESERAPFLEAACGEDFELRREVEELLAAASSDPRFLDQPAVQAEPPAEAPVHPLVGRRIGPYRVRGVVGEGGMGIVCDAEQEGEVTRRVALKVIRFGMESREVVARFAAERQAIALMNHPNIATAYDIGVTDDGRPYFVMEYVDGVPITDYCDRRRLTVRERLELFLPVCDAVQHAHQKGIVHRDLKPSNVLVGVHDGRAVPKVIDFGIAKAVNRRLTDKSFHTQVGRLIGTPEYMSPEQAGVDGTDVDTRADIYSLGVLLFELLVGALPFDGDALRAAGFADLERTLFGATLPRPSKRLETLGEGAEGAARNRGTTSGGLRRELRGDLDWIVVKAMERDRERRYANASDLAADISRYLGDEPVAAGPPTTGYRLRKFVSRHRLAVGAAAALVLLLTVFAVTSAVQSARTARALREAERERARAEQVSGFLVDLFEVSNPGEARASAITAREVLDEGAEKIERSLGDQPEVRTRLMRTLGSVYEKLGLYDRAEALLNGALGAGRRVVVPEDLEAAETLAALATVRRGKGDYGGAEALHRRSLDLRRRLLGSEHLQVAESLHNLGVALRLQGKREEAEGAYREALAIKRRQLGAEHASIANTLVSLASLRQLAGDFAGADSLYREALGMRVRLLGEGHIDVARSRNDLASLLYETGDDAGAEAFYREALGGMRAVLGDDHPDVAANLNNLALVLRRRGDLAGADPLFQEALRIRRLRLGDAHPEVAVTLNNMAFVARDRGDLALAESRFREALALFRRSLGEEHGYVANCLHNLGEVLYERGKPEGAAMLRDALERKLKAYPRSHPSVAVSLSAVGHARAEGGDPAGAEPLLREALASLGKALPDSNPRLALAKSRLGGCLLRLGRYAEAEPLLLESYTAQKKGRAVRDARATLRLLVRLYQAVGRAAEAERHQALLDALPGQPGLVAPEDLAPRPADRHPGLARRRTRGSQ